MIIEVVISGSLEFIEDFLALDVVHHQTLAAAECIVTVA